MDAATLERLRRICLALPEVVEKLTWDHPNFRVRDKIFVMFGNGEGRPSMTCKAPEGSQAILVGADPKRFYIPPYVGARGWVGMWLDDEADWVEVATLVERSYRMTPPKRLLSRR